LPQPSSYRRREPEKSTLHEIIRENLETFLAELREDGAGLPRYVEDEFRRYLKCGILEEGFTRCFCESCGDELLVAFSCKGKGFCPPCLARRMSDTAAHLVDRVLPIVPYRQWVLAYPRRLRLAFARDAKAATDSATIFLREVFRWQRREAKHSGTKRPLVGGVSFSQRFGSRLDTNVHHHVLLPDGVFTVAEDGAARFVELARPRREDLEEILPRVVKKTLAMAQRRGLLEDEPFDALSRVQAESLQTSLPLHLEEESHSAQKLSAFIDGFSLEAGAHVLESDRPGLEHLLRYMLRPPLSLKRLRRMADGRILIELKRPLYDGTRAIALTPRQFLRRLASIVPPPRIHSTRYFGVFAPASKTRPKITLARPGRAKGCVDKVPAGVIDDGGAEEMMLADALSPDLPQGDWLEGPPMPERPRRLDWPALLARVFQEDVTVCDKCAGRRRVSAFIPGGRLAREVLDQLGIHGTSPPIAKARAPPHQEEAFDLPPDDPGVSEQHAEAS
jgi:hypothetical protein